jgi:translocation and assembly module TamA
LPDGRWTTDLRENLEALPAGSKAPVQVNDRHGPLYHLGRVSIDGEVSAKARAAFALESGAPAVASLVLAAGQRLLEAMEEEGHAFAKVDDPVAYQDAHEPELDVSFKATAGAVYQLGAIHFEGMKRLNEAFLQKRLKLHPGELSTARARSSTRAPICSGAGHFLRHLGTPAKGVGGPGRHIAGHFEVQERKRHAVSVTAAYSSDLGGSGGFTWTDRNVFGNAEQLNLTASIINWGGSDTTGWATSSGRR